MLDAQLGSGLAGEIGITSGQDHAKPRLVQLAADLKTDAAIASRDERAARIAHA